MVAGGGQRLASIGVAVIAMVYTTAVHAACGIGDGGNLPHVVLLIDPNLANLNG